MKIERALAVLADPTRQAILASLAQLPQLVGELAAALPVSRSAVSQHLKVLKEAGLVKGSRRGRETRYEACGDMLAAAGGHLQALAAAAGRSPVAAGRIPASPEDTAAVGGDAIDAAMQRWAQISLAFDPATVATIARLRLVAGIMEERYAAVAGRYGLNTGEAMMLGTLRRLGAPQGTTPGELARASVIKPPSVAKRLQQLEQKGCIKRADSPLDRRSHRVRLTRKGQDTADAIVNEQLGQHYSAFFRMPEPRRKAIDQALRALLNELQPTTSVTLVSGDLNVQARPLAD